MGDSDGFGVKKRGPLISKTAKIIIFVVLMIFYIPIHTLFNPIGTFFSYFRIQAYIARYFYDYDLEISYPQFGFKGRYFRSIATLRDNENISFTVIYWGGGRFWNYYDDVLAVYLTQILEPEFGNSLRSIQTYNPRVTDRGQPVFFRTRTASIRLDVENKNPYTLANVMIDTMSLIQANNYEFESYDFHFRGDVIERMTIRGLHPQKINVEELISLLETIYDDFVYCGRYRAITHTMGDDTRAWER